MSEPVYWDPDRLDEIVSERARILGRQVWAAARPSAGPVISFAGGLPDIPSLPGELLLKAARTVIDREQKEALQYGGTFGPEPLRQAVASRSSEIEQLDLTSDQVIITSGSAHGIGIICEALIDPSDIILVESPNFPGSMRTFRTFGAELVAVPMDDDGLIVEELEAALEKLAAEGKRAKLLYTIPTHQNPAGCTMPLERRQRVVELAKKYHFLIMEDDAYGELWFDDEPPPSLYSLSGGQHAIKVCTFSKIIATGLRMGWILAPEALITRTAAVRYDMGTSPFQGRVIAEMINNGDLERHIGRLRAIYKKKLERVEESLARYCGDFCTYVKPAGGFFLWLLLRPGIPYAEVQRVAGERGVIVGGGPQFHADGASSNHLRLAFSYVPIEDIEQGINLLGEAMTEVASAVGVK